MRIKIVRIIIVGLFLMIIAELIYVQVIRGRYYHRLSKNNRIRIVPLEGWRGRIKDRNGRVLADRRVKYNVLIAPQDVNKYEELFQFLSKVLEVDQIRLERIYQQKRVAPFVPVAVAEDIKKDKAIVLEENKYRFPGLIIQEGFGRFYPLGKNSAHILGYVGKINEAQKKLSKEYGYSPQSTTGYSGVEEYYDSYLKGVQGGLQVEVNSRGQQVRLLSFKESTHGQDITLTIDSDIQEILFDLLNDKRGAIVVMDMDNGEVLGMVSAPAYDPNIFTDAQKQNQISALFSDEEAPFLNRAIKGVFPPGSVFKIPGAIAGLESKKITENTTFVCNGYHMLGRVKFRCAHTHGTQNLIESLAHSCNVYYYRVGLLLGVDIMRRYVKLFGLGDLTHIDLPYEKTGDIPSPRSSSFDGRRQWYPGDTLNFSIGQGGVLVTPLQLVKMISIVGNSGGEVQPHVIKQIGEMEVDKYNFKREIKIASEVFETVQRGLRVAVADYSGTAHVLDMKGIYVAGKTGTAQSSGKKESHSWFVGYAKGEKRKVAFCVFLEYGGSSHNACLLARQMLERMNKKGML